MIINSEHRHIGHPTSTPPSPQGFLKFLISYYILITYTFFWMESAALLPE